MKFTTTASAPDPTPQGAQFKAPWEMTKAWLRFAAAATVAVLALMLGIVAGVAFGAPEALAAGLVVAAFPALVAALLWHFTCRTQRMIYRDNEHRPIITDGPTVVFVRDRVQTPQGHVDKDPIPVDVGLPPQEAARALRWMRDNGKTSRRDVTAGAGISQSAWAKLNRALQDFGILDGGRLTDEVDYLLAQLDDL